MCHPRSLPNAGLLAVVSCLPFAYPASAEDPSGESPVISGIEEIVITGSRIKRRDFLTPSPLVTLDRADIEFSGQQTIEEALNQMPQVTPDFGRVQDFSSQNEGRATVALRSLGPGRTLVLLNGRRVGASGKFSAVDLNNLPQALIDRVEIITGGTSAVYGSDALAGVVNFITKKDYSGFSVETSANVTEEGDSESYDVNVTYGHNFADGRGNMTAYAGALTRHASYAVDREFTAIWWQDVGDGTLAEGGSNAIPGTYVFWPPAYPPGAEDLFNTTPWEYLQKPLDRLAAGLFADFSVSDRLALYAEASYARNEIASKFAPSPAYGWVAVNLDNPMLTPAAADLFAQRFACDANLACLYIGRRFMELGSRLSSEQHDFYRIVAGVRGELTEGWEFDAWAGYVSAKTREWLRNDGSWSRLQQGLLVDFVSGECYDPGGGCVPLNIFGAGNLSAEGTEFIRYRDFENAKKREHQFADVFVSGSPVSTWAGPLEIAIGAEWRSDSTKFLYDEALYGADQIGFNAQSPGDGRESVTELYAEAVVPLAEDIRFLKYLAAEAGLRYSRYGYAGGVWSYKAGLDWRVTDALQFRAMHQKSVRAPNGFEMFEEQQAIDDIRIGESDRCSVTSWDGDPVENGYVEKCAIQGLPADQVGTWQAADYYPLTWVNGGNPALRPEVGKTWTAGAVITPLRLSNWTFAVDFYELEVQDTIGPLNIIDVCFDAANTSHAFCDHISRDATGNIAEIVALTENRGLMKTRGVDLQAAWQAELPEKLSIGGGPATLGVNASWTHLLEFETQDNPVSSVYDCAGYFGGPCGTDGPGNWDGSATTFNRDRVRASIMYQGGPLSVHLAWRWIGRAKNGLWYLGNPDDDVDIVIKSVPERNYLDLGLGYSFADHLKVRAGANNLLDTGAPNMADWVYAFNTDTGLYDIFGRSYYVTLGLYY